MSPEMHASTTSWSVITAIALATLACMYLRGWYRLNQVGQREVYLIPALVITADPLSRRFAQATNSPSRMSPPAVRSLNGGVAEEL
jgi:hypothetical protein